MTAIRIGCLLAAGWATAAAAQPTEVQLRVMDGRTTGVRVVAERLSAVAGSSAAEAATGRAEIPPPDRAESSGPAPGAVDLTIGAGLWRLRAEAAGYWSAPLDLWHADDGSPQVVELTLWPTGVLTGTVTTPPGTPRPDELALRFQATPTSTVPPGGSQTCPLVEGRFRCSVPAGVLDLRLRATGFVSHYRWKSSVPPGGALDIGQIDLRPGASLVGWVETTDGTTFTERSPQLILRTRRPPPGGDEEDPARRRLMRLVTGTTERGFFHFEGLPPGRYQVYAKLAGYATAEAEVDLYDRAESTLREPLILGPPRTLEVEIQPPLDATGNPWRVTLTRWSDRRSVGEVETTASPEGRWRQEGLPEGNYSLNLADSAGARRLHHRFDVAAESLQLVLEVPSVQVHGKVRIGDRPLAARLIFGGESGAESVPITTDSEGDYAGTLPRLGRWPVTLEADEPPVRRELDVVVGEPGARGEAGVRLDFELPDTRIAGQVVDAEGRAVDRAFVFLEPHGRTETIQRPVTADGGFEIRALPPGRVDIWAEGVGTRSEPVTLELAERRGTPHLVLVLEGNLRASVVVRSANGPVPGAQVLVMPRVGKARSPIVTTGVDGLATLSHLPGSTRELTIAAFAPGFATRLFRTPVGDQEPIGIEVDQLGGTLTVQLDGHDPRGGEHIAFLSRDGARIGWQVLLNLAENQRTRTADGVRTVLPGLEAGNYAVCLAAAGEPLDTATPVLCADGRLDPLGHLELRLEVREEVGVGSTGT